MTIRRKLKTAAKRINAVIVNQSVNQSASQSASQHANQLVNQHAKRARRRSLNTLLRARNSASSGIDKFNIKMIKDTVGEDSIFFMSIFVHHGNLRELYGNSEDKDGVVLQGVRK